ncbi:MAG: hypothetical protein H7833_07730 [Magnetococcus sp. DMHC-1]
MNQLEEARRIESANAVMELVHKAGRNPPMADLWHQHDPEIRHAVRSLLEKTHRGFDPKPS